MDPVGSGSSLKTRWRNYGEERTSVDQVTSFFLVIPNVKELPGVASYDVHARRLALSFGFLAHPGWHLRAASPKSRWNWQIQALFPDFCWNWRGCWGDAAADAEGSRRLFCLPCDLSRCLLKLDLNDEGRCCCCPAGKAGVNFRWGRKRGPTAWTSPSRSSV